MHKLYKQSYLQLLYNVVWQAFLANHGMKHSCWLHFSKFLWNAPTPTELIVICLNYASEKLM